jgi:Tol biopolymer transport system component
MNLDGSHREQLTSFKTIFHDPSITRDGGTLLFPCVDGVWRLNADGSNSMQVVKAKAVWAAVISPDGAWFVYRNDEGLFK